MSDQRTRIGIIGAGFIARGHARCCHTIEETKLVAVADLDESRGRALVHDFGGDYYSDYHKLLERHDVDVVIICLPDHLHAEVSQAAARARKHILLEKPLATTLEDADKILKAVAENEIRMMVGHSLRFNVPYAALHERVKRGDIGTPVHGWARRNARIIDGRRFQGNTSVIMFLAVHDIDFLRWCIGSEVTRVYAEGNRRVLTDVGVDDSILSVLRFANGFIASLEHSWILPENFGAVVDAKVELVGENGMITFDSFDQGLSSWTQSGGSFFPPSDFLGQVRGSLYEELRHFIDCLHKKREFLVSGNDARQALIVALAIHESLKKGRPVDLT